MEERRHFLVNEKIVPTKVYESHMHPGDPHIEGIKHKELGQSVHINTHGQNFAIPDAEKHTPANGVNPFAYTGMPSKE